MQTARGDHQVPVLPADQTGHTAGQAAGAVRAGGRTGGVHPPVGAGRLRSPAAQSRLRVRVPIPAQPKRRAGDADSGAAPDAGGPASLVRRTELSRQGEVAGELRRGPASGVGRGPRRVLPGADAERHHSAQEQEHGGQLLLAQDNEDLLQGPVLYVASD